MTTCDVDNHEIEQVTHNIHNCKTDIYIPCITTYDSFLGKPNKFSFSSQVFFEFASLHKSKGIELKNRKDPVKVYRTSPIQEVLRNIVETEYKTNKNNRISDAVSLVFSATDPPVFHSIMSPELSIFEKAIVLKEYCGNLANIIVISNHEKIGEVIKKAEIESHNSLPQDIQIMNTDEWLEKNWQQNNDLIRMAINIMKKKSLQEVQFGNIIIKFTTEPPQK